MSTSVKHKVQANGRRMKYPFALMKYGDYCIVPAEIAKKASIAAYNFANRHGMYFRCAQFGRRGRIRITNLSLHRVTRTKHLNRGESHALDN